MAWTATDDFNGYSNGDLAGQGGGSGWSGNWVNGLTAQMLVTGAQTYEGAKSVDTNDASSNTFYYRLLASPISSNGNVMYYALRKSLNNSGEVMGGLRSSGGSRLSVALNAAGNLTLSGSTVVDLVTGFSVNTWYIVRVTFNVVANTATAAWSTASFGGTGSWSAESSAITMAGSGDIDRFQIQSDPNAGTSFLDYISDTEPFTPVQNLTLTIDAASYTFTGNNVGLGMIYTIVINAAEYLFSSIGINFTFRGWMNQSKNTSSYSNQSKSNSDTWSNQSKT